MRDPLSAPGDRAALTRVIGLGSPFGDDRVGWRVIEHLDGRLPPAVELLALDRPGAALAHWVGDVAQLVIVDAVSGARPAGSVVELALDEIDENAGRWSSHGLDLHQALALARALGSTPRVMQVFAVFIEDLERETPAVATAARVLAEQIATSLTRP